MQFERLVTSLFASDPAAAAAFYVSHLGMRVDMDLGWFVSLRHDDHPGIEIALTDAAHDSLPPTHRTSTRGMAIALVVEDVAYEHHRFIELGTPIVQAPLDHPWGQRQLLAEGPDGVLIDLVQYTEPDPDWLAANGIDVEGANATPSSA